MRATLWRNCVCIVYKVIAILGSRHRQKAVRKAGAISIGTNDETPRIYLGGRGDGGARKIYRGEDVAGEQKPVGIKVNISELAHNLVKLTQAVCGSTFDGSGYVNSLKYSIREQKAV